MIGRNIQSREVVPVFLDIGAFGDGETHLAKDGNHLFYGLADGVDGAGAYPPRRQSYIDTLGFQLGINMGAFQGVFTGIDGRVDIAFERVQSLAGFFALIRRHGAQTLHHFGNPALLAERTDTRLFQRIQIGGGSHLTRDLRFYLVKIFHWL